MPFDHSRAQQEEEKLLLFPEKDSANEKPWTGFTTTLPASFFSVLAGSLFLCRNWHMAHHGCRHKVAILC